MDAKSRALLASQWSRAAAELRVRIVVPGNVTSSAGGSFEFACLLPDFGSAMGILLDTTYSREATKAATALGYAFSTMDAETRLPFDVESYKECLIDWGWAAVDRPAPAWYQNGNVV
jgi:hypothetical protein